MKEPVRFIGAGPDDPGLITDLCMEWLDGYPKGLPGQIFHCWAICGMRAGLALFQVIACQVRSCRQGMKY